MNRRAKSTMMLSILLAVLFTEFLSSAAPVKPPQDHIQFVDRVASNPSDQASAPLLVVEAPQQITVDHQQLHRLAMERASQPPPEPVEEKVEPKTYTESSNFEYELELNEAKRLYEQTKNPDLLQEIKHIEKERKVFSSSRLLHNHMEDLNLVHPDEFWSTMDKFVQYRSTQLKKKVPNLSLRSQMSVMFNNFMVTDTDKEIFKTIHELMRYNAFGSIESLTKILLYLQDIEPIRSNEKAAFKRAIEGAIEVDVEEGLLDKVVIKDIARALARSQYLTSDKTIVASVISSESISDFLTETEMSTLMHEYGEALTQHQNLLEKYEIEPASDSEELTIWHAPCASLKSRRRRRRSTSDCLLSEEEYKQIVEKVDEKSGVKEVLNTEKFMNLLDQVTAEDPAAKREQLLELGADLWKNPEVSLTGDYVTEFKDVVKPLDEPVSSQMLDLPRVQLPENSLGKVPLSESHSLPLDYLNSGHIYSSHPADRITVYNPKIFHHEVVSYPRESRVPMTEFRGQYEPISMPEIGRSVEITPRKIYSPLPEISLPRSPKLGLSLVGRRG